MNEVGMWTAVWLAVFAMLVLVGAFRDLGDVSVAVSVGVPVAAADVVDWRAQRHLERNRR